MEHVHVSLMTDNITLNRLGVGFAACEEAKTDYKSTKLIDFIVIENLLVPVYKGTIGTQCSGCHAVEPTYKGHSWDPNYIHGAALQRCKETNVYTRLSSRNVSHVPPMYMYHDIYCIVGNFHGTKFSQMAPQMKICR